MKEMKKIMLAMAAIALTFASCSDDKDESGGFGDNPVKFKTAINGQAQARAAGTQWHQTDAIGIYMVTANAGLDAGCTMQNKKHTTATVNGDFVAATSAHAITFPSNGSNVDFIAYYPYKESCPSFAYAVDVATQDPHKNIDLMYSDDAKGHNKTNSSVTLGFSHKLTNVVMTVTDKGGKDLSGIKVTIKGTKTRSSFSLVNGTLSHEVASVADIVALTTNVNTSVATVEAIVLPDNGITGATMSFEVPVRGKTYKWSIPSNYEFQAGKKHILKFEIPADDNEDIVLSSGSTIVDWVEVPHTGNPIELEPDGETPQGDGSATSPFSVSQLADNINANGKWVQGYVVGVSTAARATTGQFTGPFTIDTNILLAETAGETDPDKCIVIDFNGADAIKAALNLKDNSDLLGKSVKVQGNIVGSIFGTVGLTALTSQVGGNTPGPGPGGEPEVIYSEGFGSTLVESNTKIAAFTGWDNGAPIAYTADTKTDIRKTTKFNNHVWLPASNDTYLTVSGINALGCTDLKLTFDITGNLYAVGSSFNINILKITFDGTNFPVESKILSKDDGYYDNYYNVTVELNGKTGLASSVLTFSSSSTDNTLGIRIDNIKLEGVK